jgi:hypothetical protein
MQVDNKLIQKALIVNGLLLIYFFSPNLSSFFGIVFLISLLTLSEPYGFICTKI